MKLANMLILAICTHFLVTGMKANAKEHDGKTWYVSPLLSYIKTDSDRKADDNFGLQLGIGKILNQRWNLEGSVVFNNLDFENGGGEYKQRGLLIDGLYIFNRTALDDVAATLLKNNKLKVEIAGYTDNRGDGNFNVDLSRMRAQSVKNYLVDGGVPSDNLSVKGYGESNPIADNASKEGRKKNRRVEMHLLN